MTASPKNDGADPTIEPLGLAASLSREHARSPRFNWPAALPLQPAISELALPGLDAPDRLATISQLGWKSFALTRKSLWTYGEERLSDLLAESGLSISSLSWTGGFTGTAGFTFREAIEDGRIAVDEAVRIGAPTVVIAPGLRGGHTFRHAQRVIGDGVRYLADIASRKNIALAILTAPYRRPQLRWSSVETLEQAQQLLDIANNPAVGLAVPVDRWLGHPAATAQLTALAPRIRIASSTLRSEDAAASVRPQQGMAAIMTGLRAAGFAGHWELEPAHEGDTGLSRTLPPTYFVTAYEAIAQEAMRVTAE